MNADRIDFYANQLRGVPIGDLGRKVREMLREVANEAEKEEREACAKLCDDRGERNRLAAGLPNGDRDEFYCADDIRMRSNAEGNSAGACARPVSEANES